MHQNFVMTFFQTNVFGTPFLEKITRNIFFTVVVFISWIFMSSNHKKNESIKIYIAQSAGTVEYTKCILAEV